MTNDKGILIKNIYYMLTYAFQVLKQTNYENIASEEFDNIQDMFAAILSKGIAQQLKQGLYREYIPKCEDLSVMRGKLNMRGTIRNRLQDKRLLTCEYDELSENNIFNRILKTTAVILLKQPSVAIERRTALKKVMLFFKNVDMADPLCIRWDLLSFHRNNQSYRMLLNICYFVLTGLLLTTEKGEFKMASFLDEKNMYRLFEKFVRAYYIYHRPDLNASAAQVQWNLDDGEKDFLPIMQTDITLSKDGKILIIDTKYYSHALQTREEFNSHTLHSGNIYQIFTYVKNKDVGNTGNVAGMLLYAKTEEQIAPDYDYKMSGSKISVKTLDLNVVFPKIASQLNNITDSYFGAL